jgi:hypothetical protein
VFPGKANDGLSMPFSERSNDLSGFIGQRLLKRFNIRWIIVIEKKVNFYFHFNFFKIKVKMEVRN